MIKRGIKQGGAVVLAAALMFSAFALPNAYAAPGIETDRECSIEVMTSHDEFSELQDLSITVKLYKVADVGINGVYTATEAFGAIDFSDVDSDTVAAVWEEKAMLAKEVVDAKDSEFAADAEATSEEGKAVFEGLPTGMYLVYAQPVESDYNQYEFKPYLVSLPNNYYYGTGDDAWVYDLTENNAIGLKPEKSDLYGDLVIDKTLDVYNATNGGAFFVFQIEATKTDVDTEEVRVVYSDVVAVTFDGTGTQSITIEHIPAGAEVVVTEVYSGANYEISTDATLTTAIVADEAVEVSFTNTHDGGQNGGTGLVNTFTYNNGEWTHSASTSSAN